MALTDPYASVADYRERAGLADTGHDAAIYADLVAVSRYLDRRLGRFFTKDSTAQSRLYTTPASRFPAPHGWTLSWAEAENPWRAGGLSRLLAIDDLVSLTEVVVDEDRDGSFADDTPLTANDYELLPANAALGPEPAPYTALALTPWGRLVAWPPNVRVRVTGIWGWPQVPDPVRAATIELTRILRLEGPRATTRVQETVDTAIAASAAAQRIVDDLVRHYARVEV